MGGKPISCAGSQRAKLGLPAVYKNSRGEHWPHPPCFSGRAPSLSEAHLLFTKEVGTWESLDPSGIDILILCVPERLRELEHIGSEILPLASVFSS